MFRSCQFCTWKWSTLETREWTAGVILLGTLQALECARVAKSTWTIKKWMKIMKLVQNVGVICEVERKYFTLHGFQLPFPISFPHLYALHHWLDATGLSYIFRWKQLLYFEIATCQRQLVTGKFSEILLCVVWRVLPDVSNDQFPISAGRCFATSGTERPMTQSNIPEDSTSGLTHSTERNSILLFSYILRRAEFLCQLDNLELPPLSLQK